MTCVAMSFIILIDSLHEYCRLYDSLALGGPVVRNLHAHYEFMSENSQNINREMGHVGTNNQAFPYTLTVFMHPAMFRDLTFLKSFMDSLPSYHEGESLVQIVPTH